MVIRRQYSTFVFKIIVAYSEIIIIFTKFLLEKENVMTKKPAIIKVSLSGKKQTSQRAELGSAFVRIAHKIRSSESQGQLIKIDGKYYRVKELG